jgi:hypothetical protein
VNTQLREVLDSSEYDEETRRMLMGVYDYIEKHYEMSDAEALAVVQRILEIAQSGQRMPEIIERHAAPARLQDK